MLPSVPVGDPPAPLEAMRGRGPVQLTGQRPILTVRIDAIQELAEERARVDEAVNLAFGRDERTNRLADLPRSIPRNFLTDIIREQDSHGGNLHAGDSFVHVSQLVGEFCPRQHILMQDPEARKMMMPVRPFGAQHVVWKMGLAAEAHVISQIIAGGVNAYGRWSCDCGRRVVSDMDRHDAAAQSCPICDTPCRNYKQKTFVNQSFEVIGNADLAFWHNSRLGIAEVKSMNRGDFDLLVRPRTEHVLQAALYQWMAEQAGHDTHTDVVIVYVCKDYLVRGSIYKEFQASVRDPAVVAALSVMQQQAFALKDDRAAGRVPPRSVCANADCSRAKNCPVMVQCFLKD